MSSHTSQSSLKDTTTTTTTTNSSSIIILRMRQPTNQAKRLGPSGSSGPADTSGWGTMAVPERMSTFIC
jgi:hypothetical protein